MGKTIRRSKAGGLVSDGGRHIRTQSGKRSGARSKNQQITAIAVRRVNPDLQALGRAVLAAALAEAELEATAKKTRSNNDAGSDTEADHV